MKAGKFDVWFIAWIRRNILRILLAAAVAASLAIRIFNLGYISRDFTDFLLPWFNEIKAQGGLVSLGQTIGNYNVLYMFLLSLLSYLPIDPLYSHQGALHCVRLRQGACRRPACPASCFP